MLKNNFKVFKILKVFFKVSIRFKEVEYNSGAHLLDLFLKNL